MKYFRKGIIAGKLFLLGCILTGCAQLGKAEPKIIHVESVMMYAEVEAADENTQNETVEGENETTEDIVGQNEVAMTGVIENNVVAEVIEETYEQITTDATYFDDALFIGDSRTVGLREYGDLDNADYFASPGLSIYTVPKTTLSIHGSEEMSLEELLETKDYGKIYLMLGMNELGYKFDQTVERYRTFVEDLQVKEPDAIIYLCANMHVTITRSENDEIYNNPSINMMNEEIAKLATEKELPYLDVNVLFDDENGNLDVEYASDDSHVLGKYYETWCEWLNENTLIVTAVEE